MKIVFFIIAFHLVVVKSDDYAKILLGQFNTYLECIEAHERGENSILKTDQPYCPIMFDGLKCWDAAKGGDTVQNLCPEYVPGVNKSRYSSLKCQENGTWMVNPVTGQSVADYSACPLDIDIENITSLFFRLLEKSKPEVHTLKDPVIYAAFENCVNTVLALPQRPLDSGSYCFRTFDGWGCWNDTRSEQVAYIQCPSFITGFRADKKAHKVCLDDGSWYRHPDTNTTWSNYTTCIDQDDLKFRNTINRIYIAGYSTSLLALIISLGIFFYFKSLQCTRITIHKNLFVSFIVNNIMWIYWYTCIIADPDIMLANGVGCQILHVIVHYFLVCNYFWMFCEGLYLHTLLVVAFVSENKIMKWFYLLGWGVPAVLIIIYAAVRGTSTDTRFCWIDESIYTWIISGPVCFSMMLNCIFLFNIIRMLLTKLRAVNSADAHQAKKAARATLILIPLLGLHYCLTPFRPVPGSPGEFIYETISATVTSFQGLCVALLFCFFNGEVTTALRNLTVKYFSSRHPSLTSKNATPTAV